MTAALGSEVLEPSFAAWHAQFYSHSSSSHLQVSCLLREIRSPLGTDSYFIHPFISHDTLKTVLHTQKAP